jgi:hypothetical protein
MRYESHYQDVNKDKDDNDDNDDEDTNTDNTENAKDTHVVIHVIHTTFIVGSLRIFRRITRKKRLNQKSHISYKTRRPKTNQSD